MVCSCWALPCLKGCRIFLNLENSTKFEKILVMETLIVEIDSAVKAKELSSVLSSMDFVKKVISVPEKKKLIAALQKQEEVKEFIVKRKNKAIEKYL